VSHGHRRSRHTALRKRYGHPGRFRNVITRLFPSEPGLLVKHITKSLTMSLPERVNLMTIAKTVPGRELHMLSMPRHVAPAVSPPGQPRPHRRRHPPPPTAGAHRGHPPQAPTAATHRRRPPRPPTAGADPPPLSGAYHCYPPRAQPTSAPSASPSPRRRPLKSVTPQARVTPGLNAISVIIVTENPCPVEDQGSREALKAPQGTVSPPSTIHS
jgi:hypothetical protein